MIIIAKPVKCVYCNLSFDREKEECVKIKNRYAHSKCHEIEFQKATAEQKELRELEEYIMKIFKEEFVNARIRQQIKRMREQYNYSYTGILKSLEYFFKVKKNPIEKANGGIGIVPYVYKDAYNYYYNLHMAQEKNKDKDVCTFVTTGKSIKIKAPQRKTKPKRLFDLEEE